MGLVAGKLGWESPFYCLGAQECKSRNYYKYDTYTAYLWGKKKIIVNFTNPHE